jgi:hypothetical protein
LHGAINVAQFKQNITVMFEHGAVARLTMRAFSVDFLAAYMEAAGDAVLASVGMNAGTQRPSS